MDSFLTQEELKQYGFKKIGKNVLLSRKASIYGASDICIGDNVRIDDFCILSGNITIGSHVHIAAGVMLFGGEKGIEIDDFAGISSRTAVYSESDNYLGEAMTNPTIPEKYRKIEGGKIYFGRHVLIGTGCTVLPGVCIAEGTSVGAMSLINKSLDPWSVYIGIPARKIGGREKEILKMEKMLMEEARDGE